MFETPRGGDAFVAGFKRYGVAYFTEPPQGDDALEQWGYVGLTETLPFETWRDVLPLYEAAVDADAERIDTSSRLDPQRPRPPGTVQAAR